MPVESWTLCFVSIWNITCPISAYALSALHISQSWSSEVWLFFMQSVTSKSAPPCSPLPIGAFTFESCPWHFRHDNALFVNVCYRQDQARKNGTCVNGKFTRCSQSTWQTPWRFLTHCSFSKDQGLPFGPSSLMDTVPLGSLAWVI